jgi:hypothetical protein
MPATKEKMLFNTLAHCQRITSQVGKGTGVSDCGNQAGQGNPRLWMSSERRVGEATGSLLEATEPDALGQSRAEPSKKFVELLGTTHSRFVYSTRVQVANVFGRLRVQPRSSIRSAQASLHSHLSRAGRLPRIEWASTHFRSLIHHNARKVLLPPGAKRTPVSPDIFSRRQKRLGWSSPRGPLGRDVRAPNLIPAGHGPAINHR